MGRRIIHTLLVLASGCASSPGATASPAAGPSCAGEFEAAAVVAVLEQQREAWNGGDLDGFLAGYEDSEQLLFTSGAKIRRGLAETREKYQARYGQGSETMGKLAFEILDVRGLGECKDAAIVLGRWAVSESPESGEGVFSVVLERHGERWQIVHDHTSATPAEPPAQP